MFTVHKELERKEAERQEQRSEPTESLRPEERVMKYSKGTTKEITQDVITYWHL